MISLSVLNFIALTTVLWVVAGLMILFALRTARKGRLVLSLGLSATGAAVFNLPVVALFAGWTKLVFDRQDELLESFVGKAVTAMALLFAMTGVLPFVILFGASAIGCLILYAISGFTN